MLAYQIILFSKGKGKNMRESLPFDLIFQYKDEDFTEQSLWI